MTRAAQPPGPLHIPVSALLPPQPQLLDTATAPLPSPAVILGPLPSTSPLHLALNYLNLADIPDFSDARPSTYDRALIVTGPKRAFQQALEEEDEDWTRDHGGDYGVLHRLTRVDVRYCPTPSHVLLLLTLLTTSSDVRGSHSLAKPPGLVILWNIADLFMDEVSSDENEEADQHVPPRKQFKSNVCIGDYLNVLSAARAAVRHLSSDDSGKASRPINLIVLEPELNDQATMPIFPSGAPDENDPMPRSTREKRISIRAGLEKILGTKSIGVVEAMSGQDHEVEQAASHRLVFAARPQEDIMLRQVRCGRADWASAAVVGEDEPGVEGDPGGVRWEFA